MERVHAFDEAAVVGLDAEWRFGVIQPLHRRIFAVLNRNFHCSLGAVKQGRAIGGITWQTP